MRRRDLGASTTAYVPAASVSRCGARRPRMVAGPAGNGADGPGLAGPRRHREVDGVAEPDALLRGRLLLSVCIIAAEVFPHRMLASPPPGAHPAGCQRNCPQDTQNPAHRYSLLLRNSGVNRPAYRPAYRYDSAGSRRASRHARLGAAPRPHRAGVGRGDWACGEMAWVGGRGAESSAANPAGTNSQSQAAIPGTLFWVCFRVPTKQPSQSAVQSVRPSTCCCRSALEGILDIKEAT